MASLSFDTRFFLNNWKLNYALIALAALLLSCQQEGSETTDYSAHHNEARDFCRQNGYNTDFYFLVDISKHSGKYRFWVYDFAQKKILDRGLVTHGSCNVFNDHPNAEEKVKTSNREGSHCSSEGKYRVGKRDYSSWGINVKYWLHGLESTNSNAVQRVVVLHSWSAVKDHEIYPQHTALSWGCPAVSDAFMTRLDAMLQHQNKPTLHWIIKE